MMTIKKMTRELLGNRTYDRMHITVVYNAHSEPVLIIKELVYDDEFGEVTGDGYIETLDRGRRTSICDLMDFC